MQSGRPFDCVCAGVGVVTTGKALRLAVLQEDQHLPLSSKFSLLRWVCACCGRQGHAVGWQGVLRSAGYCQRCIEDSADVDPQGVASGSVLLPVRVARHFTTDASVVPYSLVCLSCVRGQSGARLRID